MIQVFWKTKMISENMMIMNEGLENFSYCLTNLLSI